MPVKRYWEEQGPDTTKQISSVMYGAPSITNIAGTQPQQDAVTPEPKNTYKPGPVTRFGRGITGSFAKTAVNLGGFFGRQIIRDPKQQERFGITREKQKEVTDFIKSKTRQGLAGMAGGFTGEALQFIQPQKVGTGIVTGLAKLGKSQKIGKAVEAGLKTKPGKFVSGAGVTAVEESAITGDTPSGLTAVVGGALSTKVKTAKEISDAALDKAYKKLTVLIKPSRKDLLYDADPVGVLLKEGFTAKTLNGLNRQVIKKQKQIGQQIESAYNESKQFVNLDKVLEVLAKRQKAFRNQGEKGLSKKMEDILDGILSQSGNKEILTAPDMWKILKTQRKAINYKNENLKSVNDVRKELVNEMQKELNRKIPKLKNLNKKYQDLSVARDVIDKRAPVAERNQVTGLLSTIATASAASLAAGALNTNALLSLAAAGVTGIGVNKFFNYLKNPDFATKAAKLYYNMSQQQQSQFIKQFKEAKRKAILNILKEFN